MKRNLLTTILLLLVTTAYTEEVEIDGICYNLISKIKEAEVMPKPYGYSGDIIIPSTVAYNGIEYTITSLSVSSFSNSDVTSIKMPNTIRTIKENAFRSCENLRTITMSNSLNNIGKDAFIYCENIKSVYISDLNAWLNIDYESSASNPLLYGRQDKQNHLYINGVEAKDLIIPSSITQIKNYAFWGCTSIKSITISPSLKSIGKGAFGNCSSLIAVNISDLLAWYNIEFADSGSNPLFEGHHLFLNGTEIQELTIPDHLTSLGNYIFAGFSGLMSVIIPNSVSSIGDGAFQFCSNITSIDIPNDITYIGKDAFSYCSGLKSVKISNKIQTIEEGAFSYCEKLESVEIPTSVKNIKHRAFMGCSSLKAISIPSSVENVGNWAFADCVKLATISIGSGVLTIGEKNDNYNLTGGYSFYNCPELIDVFCLAKEVPVTQKNTFEKSYLEYATLHVPTSSVNAYKISEPWNKFKYFVAIDGDTPQTQKCATPNIGYANGKLKFDCETEGAEFVSEITDTDIKKNFASEVELTATYNITVYATKSGYDNSDVAKATLCWIDVDPKTEGITNNVTSVRAKAVMIQSTEGQLTVNGLDEGEQIGVYCTNGTMVGSAISHNGSATISTNLQTGSVVIVKIGERCIKVILN